MNRIQKLLIDNRNLVWDAETDAVVFATRPLPDPGGIICYVQTKAIYESIGKWYDDPVSCFMLARDSVGDIVNRLILKKRFEADGSIVITPFDLPRNKRLYAEAKIEPSDGVIGDTLIWTATGPRPARDLKVGDRLVTSIGSDGKMTLHPIRDIAKQEQVRIHATLLSDEDMATHMCYAADSLSFYSPDKGWVIAKRAAFQNEFVCLADHNQVEVVCCHLVMEAPEPARGWVWMNDKSDITRPAHIVDFSPGKALLKYAYRDRRNPPGVRYQEGIPDAAQCDIFHSERDCAFRTTVYSLRMDGANTFCIGELGVWVKNASC